MASVINTNVASLNAQKNLTKSQTALEVSLQRLSSGMRINSARDDAAGLAIASRFTSQINGLNQAARNANDGISLTQTAEGALGEISNNLQRIRELAVQSANGTNSTTDRASLDAEAQQLVAEITRVATQTSFNGINLLDKTFTQQDFQVGANANQTISVNQIAGARAVDLGSELLLAAGTAMNRVTAAATDISGGNGVAASTNMTINTVNGGTTSAFTIAASTNTKAIAAALTAAGTGVGVTATATNSATISGLSAAGDVSFTLGGTGSQAISATIAAPTDLTNLVAAINGAAGVTGVTAAFTTTSSKASITLSSGDGSDISVLNYANTSAVVGDTISLSGRVLTEGGSDSAIKTGSVSLASSKGAITLTNGDASVFNTATSSFASMAAVSLTSAANAQAAIAVVDAALGQVNVSRGDLGAYQNRFASAIANLATTSENLSASRSRIQDADYASETASMTKNQILQQAGTAMLAQANALPNNVLTLLKG